MTPVDPAVTMDGWEPKVFAKEQPQYRPVQALVRRDAYGSTLTRWRPTAEELASLLAGDDLYLEVWTFHQPLQPVRLGVWAHRVLEPPEPAQ